MTRHMFGSKDRALPVTERIRARVRTTDDGCWEWLPPVNSEGYGRLRVDGRQQYVHRLSYVAFNGPIPTGLQIDHLCRNRRCVNPAHLEAVTSRENTRRGISPPGQMHRRTHCRNGHALTTANTDTSRGWRTCRTCQTK